MSDNWQICFAFIPTPVGQRRSDGSLVYAFLQRYRWRVAPNRFGFDERRPIIDKPEIDSYFFDVGSVQ